MSAIAPEMVEQTSDRIAGMSLCDECEIRPSECELVNGAVVDKLCLDCFKELAIQQIWRTPIGSAITFRRGVGREVIVEGSATERLTDLMGCVDDEESAAGAA